MTWFMFHRLILSLRAGALIRRISLLSVFAIGLSVFAFLLVLYVMNGMNQTIQKRILALEPHLVVQDKNARKIEDYDHHPLLEKIRALPGAHYSVVETQDVVLRTVDGQFRGATVKGLTPESFQSFYRELRKLDSDNANSPRMFSEEDLVPDAGEIVIGADLARSLGLIEGDPVTAVSPEGFLLPQGEAPAFEKLRVRRYVSTNLSDFDSQIVLYQQGKSFLNFQNAASRFLSLEIWLKDPDQAPDLKTEWEKMGLDVQTWQDRNSALFYALLLEKTAIGIFLGLAGLIASSSILTVLTLIVSQKTSDIAMLRTLGMSDSSTKRLFLRMGLLLSGIGLVPGLILGVVVGYLIQFYPPNVLPATVYYDSQIPSRVSLPLAFVTFAIASLVAFFGSWFPARGVSAIQPSEVLRRKN